MDQHLVLAGIELAPDTERAGIIAPALSDDALRFMVDLANEQALRFRVEALLRIEPAPIPVAFDAALLKTQEYMVQGTD